MKTSITFSILFLLSTGAPSLAQAPAAAVRPSTTSAPSSTTTASANVKADYRIVPGDKLRIEVYKDEQLSQSVQVRPDGKITLPLVGDVLAEGRTSTELRQALVSSISEYNKNAADYVSVIVVETVPPQFYVMGEVKNPGTMPLKGQISVVQALAMAGGFTDFAKKGDILIQRKGAAGLSNVKFNYNDAVKGKATMIYLQPGDTIIVP